MKDMTAKGEALNDSMLSQQLTWWCLDLAIWHHVRSSAAKRRLLDGVKGHRLTG